MELLLKDMETVEKRLEKLKKMAKSAKKEDLRAVEVTERIYYHLESGKPGRTFTYKENEANFIESLMLLTSKPILYVCNVDEDAILEGNAYSKKMVGSV